VDSQRRTAEDLQHSLKTARDRNDRLKSMMTNRQAVAPLPPSVIAADFASIVTLKETADVYCQTPAAGVERILMELGRLAVDSAAAIQSTSSLPAAQLCQLIGDGLDLIIPHLATNGLDRDFFGSIHLQVATYLLSAPAQQQHSKEFMLAVRSVYNQCFRILTYM
jgi:hypothetical protein